MSDLLTREGSIIVCSDCGREWPITVDPMELEDHYRAWQRANEAPTVYSEPSKEGSAT